MIQRKGRTRKAKNLRQVRARSAPHFFFLKDTKGVDISTSSGVSIQRADNPALSLRKTNRPRIAPRPVSFSAGSAHKLQHNLAAMRTRAMLDQIDRLPRSERKF